MATYYPNYVPDFGVRPSLNGRYRLLLIERIRPFDVQMVYSTAYWWQRLTRHSVSVLNIWPLPVYGGLPTELQLDDFDAVVLFPRLAYDPLSLHFLDSELRIKFRDYRGLKILMRQDENFMTNYISRFVIDNEFDMLLSCVPQDQVARAYPELVKRGVPIKSMLTGYITPDMRQDSRLPYEKRTVDLFYRAYQGPMSGGRLVFDKWYIGEKAQQLLESSALKADISLNPSDRLLGSEWLARLENSRAVLATESGSNVFDFDGEIYRWEQRRKHEDDDETLDYETEYNRAFGELIGEFEGNVLYGQVSPRHFEAASTKTLQVMFPGRYSGIFTAGRHYLELRRDFSNWAEVVETLGQPIVVEEITSRAFDEIIMNDQLWIETLINDLDQTLGDMFTAAAKSRKKSDFSGVHLLIRSEDLLQEERTKQATGSDDRYLSDTVIVAFSQTVSDVARPGRAAVPRNWMHIGKVLRQQRRQLAAFCRKALDVGPDQSAMPRNWMDIAKILRQLRRQLVAFCWKALDVAPDQAAMPRGWLHVGKVLRQLRRRSSKPMNLTNSDKPVKVDAGCFIRVSFSKKETATAICTDLKERSTRTVTVLKEVAGLSTARLFHELGAIEYEGFTIDAFRQECLLGLAIADAVREIDTKGISGIIGGDPLALAGLSVLALSSEVQVYVDFDGFTEDLAERPGWQAFFWVKVFEAFLKDQPTAIALAMNDNAMNQARAIAPDILVLPRAKAAGVAGAISENQIRAHARKLRKDLSVSRTSKVKNVSSVSCGRSSNAGEIVLDTIAAKQVLSLCEEAFGLDSVRYWVQLVKFSGQLKAQNDNGEAAVELLRYGLQKYVDRVDSGKACDAEVRSIHKRLSRIVSQFLVAQGRLPKSVVFDLLRALVKSKLVHRFRSSNHIRRLGRAYRTRRGRRDRG